MMPETLNEPGGSVSSQPVVAARTAPGTPPVLRWGDAELAWLGGRRGGRLRTEIPKWGRLGHTAVTASVGVATVYPARDSPPTPEGLMSAADAALYQAKHGGRNQIRGA